MKSSEQLTATVYVATDDRKFYDISVPVGEVVEDLCIEICKRLKIGPVARHLFALRSCLSKLWLPCGHKLEDKEDLKFEFRLRFKPSSSQRLKEIDIQAYNYYFLQARTDVMDNKVSDIMYEKYRHELIGLGVTDMYRVMLEKKLPRESVESDYKKYIPKVCIKKHFFFIKKPIHYAFNTLEKEADPLYVKEQYLKQFESMAPNYLTEEYKALMNTSLSNPWIPVLLRIDSEEVKYSDMTDSDTWKTLCTIVDLCFISISVDNRNDYSLRIAKKNGIPSHLKLDTYSVLMSFVSALDGYYRLSIKWTFNLCTDVSTPSLERLHMLKCHGPVGKEFSYAKIKKKRANKPGTYILRESDTEYNVYYIDVCGKDGKVSSRRVERHGGNEFSIAGNVDVYKSLPALLQDPVNSLHLEECLPPSEYDISPLLISASENIVSDVIAEEEIVTAVLEGEPRCVSRNQLQVFEEIFRNEENLTRHKVTQLHRATWRVAKGKKVDVLLKILKTEENSYTKEFLELADKWGQLRSSALVRLYGVTMAPSIGMVLELSTLGPLDKYLSSNSQIIQIADLLDATSCLATAVWHLEENDVVHGNIRCKRILVHEHTETKFTVKLGDPGLYTYTADDIHWIPPECHKNLESAKNSFQADIWALGTTIWEIFSKGTPPLRYPDVNIVKMFYENGERLPPPKGCPKEIYNLMRECWGDKGKSRKQPQAIMRDVNQIIYQVFNSRRTYHSYATTYPKLSEDTEDEDNSDTENKSNSDSNASSLLTDHTSLSWNETNRVRWITDPQENCQTELTKYLALLNNAVGCNGGNDRNSHSTHGSFDEGIPFKNGYANDNGSIDGNSKSSYIQQMFYSTEMSAEYDIVVQGRVGQGFYGEVFRATLVKRDNEHETRQVAIKILKTSLEADMRDFEREIMIMKTLKHPNIIEIIAGLDGGLIMEFVEHGSLQSYLVIHRESLTHTKLLNFALDIATGMDYLGRMNIVHRDLAARNILVASENRVKISDFGLARVMDKNDYYILNTNRDLPIKWYAPESLRDGKFSSRSDVWSFGVTMYETFSLGEDPKLPDIVTYRNLHYIEEKGSVELLSALESGARLPCPPTCPQEIYTKLMYPCWNIQSHERPDFATLCRQIQNLLTKY
ncbi:tyrosine-protein kinase JAK2 [Pseudomyrmex gracilis]|uniref:tyrosine-protein kinase JAK2 n=1 Tax=Pseudomyrmex gracilis TaxID=219809 RepID=UPI0009950010|nr:tyrosine-protein kinase JAK2 [Pseudomyrmex gracilis]